MDILTHLRKLVEARIAQLKLNTEPAELYDPIAYTMALGGKRMRPILTLLGCELFGGKAEDALSAAVGIEVFHNFTLLHDDIMDDAPLRRNEPTVHARWNSNIALLSGDVMFVIANQLMLESDQRTWPQILPVFHQTSIEVCEGQQMDMNFETATNVSIADYMTMIGYKTSVLLAASLKIGAYIGGADEANAGHAYLFGKHLGLAFQLQDDLLDVYGDPDKFGKQVGGDILSNKKTFLLLNALRLAEGESAAELNQWLSNNSSDKAEKVAAVTRIYDGLGIRQLTMQEMDRHYQKAMEQLDAIPVPEANKNGLRAIAEMLMVREV